MLMAEEDDDHLVRVDENVDGRGDSKEKVTELDHLSIEHHQSPCHCFFQIILNLFFAK